MKKVIRHSILAKRDALSPSVIRHKSAIITKTLGHLKELKNAQMVFSYISFGSEVHTHNFIKSLLKNRQVAVPFVINKRVKQLAVSSLYDWNHLSSGVYGILEPKKEFINPISLDAIDVFIVPGVAFDIGGHRIGYGCGYFDKTLRQVEALKIGLAFDIQIVSSIPAMSYDVAMDRIITEKRIIHPGFRKGC